MNNNDNKRFCERFNMTPQEYQNFKDRKVTRLFWYIPLMILSTIFYDRALCYVALTFWLLYSYWYDKKCEEQWEEDARMRH